MKHKKNFSNLVLLFNLFWVLPLLFIIGCKDKKVVPKNAAPSEFSVSVVPSNTSAVLNWTTATDPDGDKVKYGVVLNGAEVEASLEGITYTLEALEKETNYTGKVVAADGKGGFTESKFSFTTVEPVNNPPGDFTVSSAVGGNGATISWTAATDPDGDAVKYDVELSGSNVKTDLTGLTHTLTSLDYNTNYTGKVIAKDGKGGTKEKSYSFTTGVAPNNPPGDFVAKFDWFDGNLVGFSWTSAIDPDGDAVTYNTALDGTTIESGLTGNESSINNLLYSTNYTITVTASDGKGGTSSDSFTFTTLAAPPELPVTHLSYLLTEGDLFQSKDDYEFGLEFEPTKDGKITALGARLCFGNYKVTLWDVDTKSIITSTNVNITATDCETLTMVNIAPVNVTAGKKYMVTTNANNWYRYDSDGGGDILPATKGNIKFNRYGWVLTFGAITTFPTTFHLDYFAGIVEFEFVPNH